MKMDIWGMFWGIFFILLGFNIILKTFFHLDFPFFRVAVALLIILAGIRVMFPGLHGRGSSPVIIDEQTTMFAEQTIAGEKIPAEHSVVFGSIKLDLTKADVSKATASIKVDAVFGGAGIIIDASKPVKITASSAFGGILLPNGNSTAFGTMTYESDSYKEGQPHLELVVNAVFGGVEIKNR
jgi:predicted membrane protein